MPHFTDKTEILLRQVHPSFIQEGRISSQAFRPTPKDQKKLSVNRNSMIKAQEAFLFYTEKRKLVSAGIWGVSVGEVAEIPELNILEDPITSPPEDLSHSLIDFSDIDSENKIKAISSKLAAKARTRGSLFAPPHNIVIKKPEFDEIRVRYRAQKRVLVREIILNKLHGLPLSRYITSQTRQQILPEDQQSFLEDIEEDLKYIDESLISIFGITPEELTLWQNARTS